MRLSTIQNSFKSARKRQEREATTEELRAHIRELEQEISLVKHSNPLRWDWSFKFPITTQLGDGFIRPRSLPSHRLMPLPSMMILDLLSLHSQPSHFLRQFDFFCRSMSLGLTALAYQRRYSFLVTDASYPASILLLQSFVFSRPSGSQPFLYSHVYSH